MAVSIQASPSGDPIEAELPVPLFRTNGQARA